MIDRRDIAGFTIAALGHAGLLAAIYFWPWHEEPKPLPENEPIQVTLADDVGLVSADPDPSDEPPAQAAQGDDQPDDTDAAPPDPTTEPEKKPPTPRDNPDAVKQPPTPPKRNQQGQQGTGGRKGSLDFKPSDFDGPAPDPTNGKGTKPEATMTDEAQQNIVSAIVRQVKPCADRQVIPAPEARQIRAVVQLRLNRDGTLAGPIKILRHEGVDESNQRYVGRVDDAVEAIFAGCTPIRGLPPELYDVQRGWRQITFRYRLRN